VQQFGLDQVPVLGRFGFRRRGNDPVSQPRHLRLAMEELGTTAIKLGQILSTRDDLLPPAYIDELSQLRENVPPAPVEDIIAVIEAELGQPLEDLYATFERQPLAVASIGQVHAARLHDGCEVIVKVQRPEVPEQVERDLAILRQLAGFAQRHAPLAEHYDLVELAEEFTWTLRNELDYMREGRNADLFRNGFRDDAEVVIPAVHWDRTTDRVLTLERIDGLRIDDIAGLEAAGIDRPALAKRAAQVILDEVFTLRFFHADPHPGNFAVLPDGRIVAYDFGMVGRISARASRALLTLLRAVVQDDSDRVIDAAIDLDVIRGTFDRTALARDINRMLDRYRLLRIEDYDFERVAADVMRLIRTYQMRLPGDLALLLKTLAMHESSARRLDPNFMPIEIAAPYARRAFLERYLPSSWGSRMVASGDELFELLLDGPKRVDRLLTQIERGDVRTTMHLADWEQMLGQVRALVNRLVIAWLMGTSLIALSVMLAIYRPDWIAGWLGPLFWLGAATTVVAGGFLALLLLRRRL
jgi:ubiquinone biosynthesis protein